MCEVSSRPLREVMALVAAGLSNDKITEHLVVSPAMAKIHLDCMSLEDAIERVRRWARASGMDLPQPGEVQPARRFLDADAELSSSLQDPKMRCRAFLGDDHGTLRNRCMRWADEQLRRLPP